MKITFCFCVAGVVFLLGSFPKSINSDLIHRQSTGNKGGTICYSVKHPSKLSILYAETKCDEDDDSVLTLTQTSEIIPALLQSASTAKKGDKTTTATSRDTTKGVDCFEVIGNQSFHIGDGSSTVNANCTRILSCINGTIDARMYTCSPHAVCEVQNDVHKCYCINGYRGDGETCINLFNCLDVFNAGYTTNGIYTVAPSNWSRSPFQVYCNMSEDGGWTVFQRRVDGSVNFDRNWASYKEGFGELDHEFWLGNEKLYYLTNQDNCTLRIDLVGSQGNPHYAEYDLFRINDESDNYRLSRLGTFAGTAGNALTDHLSDSFSTLDRDDDYRNGYHCWEAHHGAWWCEGCCYSNLNGDYHSAVHLSSIFWDGPDKTWHHIKHTEMKIKPKM